MKRRLRHLYWTGIVITMAMATVVMAMMVKLKIDDTRESLCSDSPRRFGLDDGVHGGSAEHGREHRLGLPAAAGDVSHGAGAGAGRQRGRRPLHGEPRATRPEVQEALQGGIGESLRFSDTQAVATLYAAMRISPVLILRLSYPLWELAGVLAAYGAGLLCLFLILYVLQRRTLSRFGRDLLVQMDEVRRLLEGDAGHGRAVFPELQPALDNISYLARRLREDLSEVSRTLTLRDDFVANASHELRSPLTSVMGFAEMLDEDMADSPEERELCVRMIRSECQRMLDVIEDILHLSRAEAQPAEEAHAVDVGGVAREIATSLSAQASQKGIEIRVEGEMVRKGVEKDFWEILYNLAGNAVRYGREGGHVWIRLTGDAIEVEDDGVGIAPEHLPHIFEQFYRVDESRGMAPGGTGLGLSIVRALAERCGARVTVESEAGKGSTFAVRFDAEAGKEQA